MGRVATYDVDAGEAGLRLDRWFRRRFPGLTHGRLQRLLREGQVRVDGKRAKANDRLEGGERVRVPPLPETPAPAPRARIAPGDEAWIQARVIHRDADVIAIDKPAGLAVQGGSRTTRHLDGLLDALRFGAPERPRLVHRLDKDTSGVLLLARGQAVAAHLTAAFRRHEVRKLYWAITVGVPRPHRGEIDLQLAKGGGRSGERVGPAAVGGQQAITRYAVAEAAGRRAAWVALMPLTGRTHQLRVHMAAIACPILGDGKYGGLDAFLAGLPEARRLHLHARALALPRPSGGEMRVVAPLPDHMAETWRFLGFESGGKDDPFAMFEELD